MPRYDYTCPFCGFQFEAVRSLDDSTTECSKCLEQATREAVYQEQMVAPGVGQVASDGPIMPPKENVAEVQGELHQDMKKLGYDDSHLLEDMRGSRSWDDEGRMFVDTSKLPQTLDTKELKKK